MAWLVIILCSCPTVAPVTNLNANFTYACPEPVEGTATPLRCAAGAGGQMVKVVFNANSANPSTTVYVSGSYQIADGVVTKYYEGGAFRVGTTLYYGLSDHIGSTGVVVSDSGAKLAEMRYTAWGEVRYQDGSLPTDRTYTGQRWVLRKTVGKFSQNAPNNRFTATFAPFYARLKKSPTVLRYTRTWGLA